MHGATSGFAKIQDARVQSRDVREAARHEGQAFDHGRRGQERIGRRHRSNRAHPFKLRGNGCIDRRNALAEARLQEARRVSPGAGSKRNAASGGVSEN